jgi:hypothetical protein
MVADYCPVPDDEGVCRYEERITETKIYCDHCGKVLDEISDYVDLTISAAHKRKCTDLCTDCFEKMFVVLRVFCDKKEVGRSERIKELD